MKEADWGAHSRDLMLLEFWLQAIPNTRLKVFLIGVSTVTAPCPLFGLLLPQLPI
jgi:hypothetical protein